MPIVNDPKTESGEDEIGKFSATLLSDAGGLTQFGAFAETLFPNSFASKPHWHANEDEMIYILSGTVCLHEGGTITAMTAGDAATFKAGVAVGHCLENNSELPATYLVIGTRSGADVVTYPETGNVLTVKDGVKTLCDSTGAVVSTTPYHGG